MKVKELIKELEKYDSELVVFWESDEAGVVYPFRLVAHNNGLELI